MPDQPKSSSTPATSSGRPLTELIHEFALSDLVQSKIPPGLPPPVADAAPPTSEDIARVLAALGEVQPVSARPLDTFLRERTGLRELGATKPASAKPAGPTKTTAARPPAGATPPRPAKSWALRRLS